MCIQQLSCQQMEYCKESIELRWNRKDKQKQLLKIISKQWTNILLHTSWNGQSARSAKSIKEQQTNKKPHEHRRCTKRSSRADQKQKVIQKRHNPQALRNEINVNTSVHTNKSTDIWIRKNSILLALRKSVTAVTKAVQAVAVLYSNTDRASDCDCISYGS